MKVLLINSLYYPNQVGGAERSVQFLAEALVEAGHQATVLSTSPASKLREGEINGVHAYYVPLKNFYWPFESKTNHIAKGLKPVWHGLDIYNPWMARAVRWILDLKKPDLVHTNNLAGFSTAVWKEVKGQNLPLVHTLRDHYLLCPRTIMYKGGRNCATPCWDCRMYSLPKCRETSRVDVVIGISRYILERHLHSGCFSKATPHVIYNSLSPVAVQPDKADATSPVRFGYLGALYPGKGIGFLLEAFGTLPQAAVSLDVAGTGTPEYESFLRGRYAAPSVRFLGHSKPETFFATIDVLVVPSLLQEAFGRVIAEAYAHGVPVVASNRGGMPEIVDEGKTGFLFDPEHPESLRVALMRFLEDRQLLTRMRPNLSAKTKIFLSETIVEKHLEVYNSVFTRSDRAAGS